jgi:uncharacterized lipoprotein
MKNYLLSATVIGALVLFVALAEAQYADDSQTLFPETPSLEHYETDKHSLVIWEFSTKPEDEDIDSSAQSVEDICCNIDDAERANQAICIDVDFSCQ